MARKSHGYRSLPHSGRGGTFKGVPAFINKSPERRPVRRSVSSSLARTNQQFGHIETCALVNH